MDPTPDCVVSLTIPNRPEYVRVVRLALSGVASRMMFSYDDIEDIKLAVAEGCNTVIEQLGTQSEQAEVEIRCTVWEEKLVIDIQGTPPAAAEGEASRPAGASELSLLLMRSLMDEVHIAEPPAPPHITLIKRPSR
jgi:serine/threonine-protein kinase RsbW